MIFDSSEIFKEPEIAVNICGDVETDLYSLTPRQLYQEIKRIADSRYGYTLLPKKLQQLKCLDSIKNKMSLLRDLCKCTGIQMSFTEAK